MSMKHVKKMFAVAVLSSIAIPLFADEAPVYDVDNYPPQFDGQPLSSNTSVDPQEPRPADVPQAPAQPSLSLSQRLQRAEQQINNMQHSASPAKVDGLQTEIQTLRNQVEELTHQVQQLQNQQRAMYTDIDSRISKLPASAPMAKSQAVDNHASLSGSKALAKKSLSTPMAPSSAPSLVNQPNVAEEQQIYQTAYDLIKSKKYNEAILTLKKMLQKYPSGQFAANAHYWLGELYGLLNKNAESAAEFGIIVSQYPKSPKVSDAELKLGLIYVAESKWQDAKVTFKKVINRYPGSASARLASEQLKQIKVIGH